MTAFSTIRIKVKPHVKHFLVHQFGHPCLFPSGHILGEYLNVLLSRPMKVDNHFTTDYPCTVLIGINETEFRRYGFGLTKTNRKNFNLAVENFIDLQIRTIAENILASTSTNENWKKRYEDLDKEHKALLEIHKAGIESLNAAKYRKFNIAINKRIQEHDQNKIKEGHALQIAAYDCLGFTEDILSFDAIKKRFFRYKKAQKR